MSAPKKKVNEKLEDNLLAQLVRNYNLHLAKHMYNSENSAKADSLLTNCFLRKTDGKVNYIPRKFFLHSYF